MAFSKLELAQIAFLALDAADFMRTSGFVGKFDERDFLPVEIRSAINANEQNEEYISILEDVFKDNGYSQLST